MIINKLHITMFDFLKNGKGDLLSFFFKNTDKEYYLNEIGKSLGKEPSYYQRYLDSFVEEGILKDERKGNMRFFKLNKDHPLYGDLKSIISKTFGIEFKLKEIINKLEGVEYAFVFGSIAKSKENTTSDIDLMLIGKDIDQDLLITEITKNEKFLGREINYHVFSPEEVVCKLNAGESFFSNIFNDPIIILKGNPYELRKSD